MLKQIVIVLILLYGFQCSSVEKKLSDYRLALIDAYGVIVSGDHDRMTTAMTTCGNIVYELPHNIMQYYARLSHDKIREWKEADAPILDVIQEVKESDKFSYTGND
jgi:hypothetical protein